MADSFKTLGELMQELRSALVNLQTAEMAIMRYETSTGRKDVVEIANLYLDTHPETTYNGMQSALIVIEFTIDVSRPVLPDCDTF